LIQLQQLLFVVRAIAAELSSALRIQLAKPRHQAIDVAHRPLGRHPGMGVGLACVGIALNQQGFHALAEGQAGHIPRCAQKAVGPQLQPQAVFHHQISIGSLFQIAGGGLIAMDLSARLHDRAHLQAISSHLAGHVGQHREGGEHHRLVVALLGLFSLWGCSAAGHQS